MTRRAKGFSTSFDSFIVRYISIERRNVKCHKKGSRGSSFKSSNVIVVCKKYYIDTLVKELGINNINSNNPTYIPIDDSF